MDTKFVLCRTESEEKSNCSLSEEEDSISCDDDTEKDFDETPEKNFCALSATRRPDFNEKLDIFKKNLRFNTNELVYEYLKTYLEVRSPTTYTTCSPKSHNLRRKSILPGQVPFSLSDKTFIPIDIPGFEISRNSPRECYNASPVEIREKLKTLNVHNSDSSDCSNKSSPVEHRPETCKKVAEACNALTTKVENRLLRTEPKKPFEIEADELLRHEIRNLRKTRNWLVEQRRKLDIKVNKEKIFTSIDERKFLECDEAIEAIDSSIEYKNDLILGHNEERLEDLETGDQMLLDRLMNLSETEMRSILHKYFKKIVDLRESGRKYEQLIGEQDQQIEAQNWKIQALSNALQQASIENERRLVTVTREHQEKMSLMFQHYVGDSSEGSCDGNKLVFQNQALKHRIVELEGLLHSQESLEGKQGRSIPQQNLIKLQGSSSGPVTKVTRHKNKLIITSQAHKSKLHK